MISPFRAFWHWGLGQRQAEFVASHRQASQEETDRLFSQGLPDHGITYLSLYNTVCSPECTLWANGAVPLQFDYGHLTKDGSMLVASRLARLLFPPTHGRGNEQASQ